MNKFIEFLKKDGKFRCNNTQNEQLHDFQITHYVNPPAAKEQLDGLKKIMNGQDRGQLEAFYSQFNGCLLFTQPGKDDGGIFISPIDQLNDVNNDWRSWFEDLDESYMYNFQKHGVAFGGPPATGNYFVYYDGKIYYSDHDGGDDTVLANSLEELLETIMNEPAKLLFDLGCFTRFYDEETNTEWFPKEYLLS